MKILISITICILCLSFIQSCSTKKPKQYGSLEGNIYWKYNNFVGNRPDAGAEINIYNMSDSSLTYEAESDVRGDYAFDSLETGRYLLVIRSKKVNSSASDIARKIRPYTREVEDVFHEKINPAFLELFSQYRHYDSLEGVYLMEDKSYKKSQIMRDSAEVFAEKALDTLPSKIRLYLGAFRFGRKLEIRGVTINPSKKEKIVTDFGITYF